MNTPMGPMKRAVVSFDAHKAWESWAFEVPEEADEQWIRDHIDELWMNHVIGQEETGNDGLSISEVEVDEPGEDEQEVLV